MLEPFEVTKEIFEVFGRELAGHGKRALLQVRRSIVQIFCLYSGVFLKGTLTLKSSGLSVSSIDAIVANLKEHSLHVLCLTISPWAV
jgi:hypothetical protein